METGNAALIKNTLAAALAAALLGASACAHHPLRRLPAPPSAAVQRNAALAGAPGGMDAAEPALRGATMHPLPDLKPVHFPYDSSRLGADVRAVLVQNADWLKTHPDVRVQVAGHCDQRGTVEYNLALGQRRAAAVRDYYLKLGIAGSRIATISYGKEKPRCAQAEESCWRQNRRAETLGAFPEPANVSVQ